MAQLGGSASGEVEASLEACWAIAQDVASAPDWQKGLKTMRVLERDGRGRPSLCESTSETKVRDITMRLRFRYEEPNRVSWTQEKGDLKRLDGEWRLEDLGGGRTRVTYSLDGDPGRVLGMLVRGPVEGKIREVLVHGRPAEFKARVEGA